MHTNHRRKKPKSGYKGSFYNISKKWWKLFKSSKRRAQERELMELELYDDLPNRYNHDILWDMF